MIKLTSVALGSMFLIACNPTYNNLNNNKPNENSYQHKLLANISNKRNYSHKDKPSEIRSKKSSTVIKSKYVNPNKRRTTVVHANSNDDIENKHKINNTVDNSSINKLNADIDNVTSSNKNSNSVINKVDNKNYYIVKKGDTLYSIAKNYNIDLTDLLRLNNISNDYNISVGKKLIVTGKSKTPTTRSVQWAWPVSSPVVINKFSMDNKGISLTHKMNTPILASRAGEVVYSGNALRGYGKLVIIKHDDVYLTAYAHNNTILVNEGDKVSSGQQIATMGKTGTDKIKLHFEIRKNGNPVNPSNYLPNF